MSQLDQVDLPACLGCGEAVCMTYAICPYIHGTIDSPTTAHTLSAGWVLRCSSVDDLHFNYEKHTSGRSREGKIFHFDRVLSRAGAYAVGRWTGEEMNASPSAVKSRSMSWIGDGVCREQQYYTVSEREESMCEKSVGKSTAVGQEPSSTELLAGFKEAGGLAKLGLNRMYSASLGRVAHVCRRMAYLVHTVDNLQAAGRELIWAPPLALI
ncbi:unnamed protein product [Periconia digitata]|uniref:Uncharacterized protein n=1 Tax=Periconia digitata TaxID=1303443 RepID=A0A9W4XHT4_9PLEO|nr:unnamed protein product [Periconia digitata]